MRIYWDITPAETGIDYGTLCDEITALRIFSLNLYDAGPALSTPGRHILERLASHTIMVSLTVPPSVLNASGPEFFSGLKVNELLVDASSRDDLRFIAGMRKQHRDLKMTIGVSVQADDQNFRNIPDILSFCLSHDLSRLVFPMQRLTAGNRCVYIGREEGRALSERLKGMHLERMNITIHDPFLWKIFYPDVSFPGGGCQAANTMAYISPDGSVYPCPSLPVRLGSVTDTSLKKILLSAHKKELRGRLVQPPEECLPCGERDQCLGGCRGRVFALSGSLTGQDPACR
ncbi:MAG: GeoRSP system SPASM domain protein [Nitrospiraceae bacterium]|nr:MAG: GeoRSP system SPASM domain protein [Nitrospiraceae bacterium]